MEISIEHTLSSNMAASTEMFEKLTENISKHIVLLRTQIRSININVLKNLVKLEENIQFQEHKLAEIDKTVGESTEKLQTIRLKLTIRYKLSVKTLTRCFLPANKHYKI